MATLRTHPRWHAWWPFALLCLLAATRSMLADASPTSATTLLSASAGCAADALVFLLVSRTSRPTSHTLSTQPRILLAGVLLLAGPLCSLLLTGHGIDPNALTLALALVPVVAAVAQNALSDALPGSFAARTWPALATVTGLLLLIPQPSLANPITDAVLILAPLATGIGAALFSTSAPKQIQPPTFTFTFSAAALLFAAAWLVHFFLDRTAAHFSPLAAVLDAATAFLTLLALSRIGVTRWSAQFALVPLTLILQFFIMFRPAIDTYKSAGVALLALGCIFLLLPQPTEKAG